MDNQKNSKDEYYKNGLKKWSSYPMLSRISFIVSLISLLVVIATSLSPR